MVSYKSVYLEPSAVRASSGWTNVGGATSLAAALADASDATYADLSATADYAVAYIDMDTTNPAIPAGAKIDSVHSHLRVKENTSGIVWRTYPQNWLKIIQHLGRGTRMYATVDVLNDDPGVFVDYRWGHWATPDGKEWTAEDLNNLILSVAITQQVPNLDWFAARARFEVWYNERPAISITSPTAAQVITNTVRPKITYTYSDPENDPQVAHRVKVVTDAVHAAAGFSWDTAKTVFDPGEEFSGFGERIVDVNLVNNTTYWVGIEGRQDWPRGRHTSAWAEVSFSISLTPLTALTLTATSQSTSALGPRVELAISGATAANVVTVEYSDDAGATWNVHPRLPSLTGATSYTVYDYELPASKARRYRVRQVTADGTNSSAYTTSADLTLTFTGWFLKDVVDPNRNIRLRVNDPVPTLRREDQGVFWPLVAADGDRVAYPSLVRGGRRSRELTLDTSFGTQDEWEAFETIRAGQRTLLLQNGYGVQMWVALGSDVEDQLLSRNPTRALRSVTLPFLEMRPVT